MEVDGTYFNIERFLNKMETLKRALLVTGITLNMNSGSGTTGGSTIVASAGRGLAGSRSHHHVPGLHGLVRGRSWQLPAAHDDHHRYHRHDRRHHQRHLVDHVLVDAGPVGRQSSDV